jgi:DNA-binding NarL/FixJ family response regulator
MNDDAPRVLVVEDDPSWQQLLGEILEDIGLAVDMAGSVERAAEQIRGQRHRLAILDLSLGGRDHNNQDGLRVAEMVRRSDPGCLVLFLTGFATVELAVQVMKEQGAFTCLRKEVFRRAEFRKVIHDALAQAPADGNGGEVEHGAPPGGRDARDGALAGGPGSVANRPDALLVEDDAGWRGLLGELLQDAGYTPRACSSYVEAAGYLRRARPALAVIDLSLASSLAHDNLDGFRLLDGLQRGGVPVIVVSGYADPERIARAYDQQRIFACLEKQAFDRKTFLQTVHSAAGAGPADPVLTSLTEREREVLRLLARGMTNKEIAVALTITPNTVKRHLKSLFAKLDVNTRSAASARAIQMGMQ